MQDERTARGNGDDVTGKEHRAVLARLTGDGVDDSSERLRVRVAGEMVTRVFGGKPSSFPKAAMGLRGVTGWVEHPGEVAPGTKVEVRLP